MTPLRRIRFIFAILLGAAIVAVGVLGRALAWPASPTTGLAVAGSGLAAAAAGGLALRMLVVVDRRSTSAPGRAPVRDPGAAARGR